MEHGRTLLEIVSQQRLASVDSKVARQCFLEMHVKTEVIADLPQKDDVDGRSRGQSVDKLLRVHVEFTALFECCESGAPIVPTTVSFFLIRILLECVMQ